MTKKFQGKTYLDPKYDPAFKELFDSEDAVKDFLNDILKLEIGDKIFSKNKYIMISLPKFKKSEKEVHSHLDAWLYLLNHAGTDNNVPDFGNRIIKEALERIRVDKADNKLLARQGNAMKRDEEYQTRLASAVVKANIKLLGALIDAGKITIDDAVKASRYSKEMLGFKQ